MTETSKGNRTAESHSVIADLVCILDLLLGVLGSLSNKNSSPVIHWHRIVIKYSSLRTWEQIE